MRRTKAAPPSQHDVIAIQHFSHKLPDTDGERMLPDRSQQDRACALPLKLIRHSEGDLGLVCMLARSPERAASHAWNVVIVFDDNDPARMPLLVFRTEPVNEGWIGTSKACPESKVRRFR